MEAVSVRELKNNPSAALRAARKQPVMVLSRHEPEALLVHLDNDSVLSEPGIRLALATALFHERQLSLGRAASFAKLELAEFIQHLGIQGVPVVSGTAKSVAEDIETAEAWLNRPS